MYGLNPKIKIVKSEITSPTRSPMSMVIIMTVRNVESHTRASSLLSFQKRKKSDTWNNSPFKATIMTLARTL